MVGFFLLGLCVCMFSCLSVCHSLPLVRFSQLVRFVDRGIVNIMKAYIESNNLHVELIGVAVTNVNFIHVYFCGFNAISPTERKSRQWLSDTVHGILSLETMGVDNSRGSNLADFLSFNWCVVVFLSTVVFMSTCITVVIRPSSA